MDMVLSLFIGLGLAAACGFRVFVPLLIMSLASRAEVGHLVLNPHFAWIGSTPALVAFSVATLLEIAGYYIPWVDNLLDTVATPTAIVAGILVTASAMTTDVSPFLKWTLAVLAGGGTTAVFQGITATARHISSFTTGGLGNPVLATAEAGGAALLAVLAITLPVVAFLLGDAGKDVTGQIFAVRMNEIFLMSQSRPLRSIHRTEGWTVQSLAEHGMPALKSSFYKLDRSADIFNWDAI